MAVEIYGVDETIIKSSLPQLNVGPNAPLTTARLDELIAEKAALLNAHLIATYGAGVEQIIANDPTGVPYKNCQRVIVTLVLPDALQGTHHDFDTDALEPLREEVDTLLGRLRTDPVAEIGLLLEGRSPSISTSSKTIGLPMDKESIRKRRRWDSRARGKDERGFVF